MREDMSISRPQKRVEMLDVTRLVAAVSVIFIHVSFTASASPDTGEFLRFLMRWAVPFFFLLTGYFLKENDGFPEINSDRLCRVLVITLTANLAYFPVLIFSDGVQAINVNMIASGSWFHLWFLSSLVFGMLSFIVLNKSRLSPSATTIFSLIFIFLAQALDIISSFDERYTPIARFFRFGMSGPLMWVGFLLSGSRMRSAVPLHAITMITVGITVCVAETLLYSWVGVSVFNRQYSVSSLIIAIGILAWASNSLHRPSQHIVNMGRDYSLIIYIVHPLFLKATALILSNYSSPDLIPYWQLVFGPILSIAFAYALERYTPIIYKLLNGEIPDWQYNSSGVRRFHRPPAE